MWHDNETETDLLGFDQLVDTVVFLAKEKSLLPLTIGVFGDWGSGKSSLMAMARRQLAAEPGYLCVTFSPWQYEDYDDVKAALMASVMATLQEHRELFDRLEDTAGREARRLLPQLIRRVNWLRALRLAAKGVASGLLLAHGHEAGASLALSGVGDVAQLRQPEGLAELTKTLSEGGKDILKPVEAHEKVPAQVDGLDSIEQSVGHFRSDFAALLRHVNIEALIVFIDDLDRCLPATVIDSLEAIRLFLAVPKTAFIIGADERIIQHAIATRYPEMPGQAINIGRDYLEKIIQVPVRIPPLNPSETETYLNLLGGQLYLQDEEKYKRLVESATENRKKAALDIAMNYGIAQSCLGAVPTPLIEHMRLIGEIAPTLCGGFHGNPRYTKRFMNTLLLRQRLAKVRNVDLDAAVLAKLMVLENFRETNFRQLHQWQAEGHGLGAPLVALEAAARDQDGKKPAVPPSHEPWLADLQLLSWLCLEPSLANVNLEPYFHFSRDRLFTAGAVARRLSQQLQEVLGLLQSESDAARVKGKQTAVSLPVEELGSLYEELLRRFQREPRALAGKLGELIVGLAVERRELMPHLARSLRLTPVTGIQSALAPTIASYFGVKEALPQELREVLQSWANQSDASALARAAQQALSRVTSR